MEDPLYTPKYGFVIILDALGTRGLWANENPRKAIENRLDLRDFLLGHLKEFKVATFESMEKGRTPELAKVQVEIQFVSDTLIVAIVPARNTELGILLASVASLFGSAFARAIGHGVLYRGAISCGTFYSAKEFMLGPAVDEAAEWSDLADWAGVMFTPSAEAQVERAIDRVPGRHIAGIVPWVVQMKGPGGSTRSRVKSWVIAWPWWAKSLRDSLEGLFLRSPVSPEVSSKHRNTMGFFDACWDGTVPVQHVFVPAGSTTDAAPPMEFPPGSLKRELGRLTKGRPRRKKSGR